MPHVKLDLFGLAKKVAEMGNIREKGNVDESEWTLSDQSEDEYQVPLRPRSEYCNSNTEKVGKGGF